ncbi:MAG TPA: dephospho-CoA kinase [Nevskiaceae bacterium]|nr:dephospho-CoA kinase [Nevskiaceae bacterium]
MAVYTVGLTGGIASGKSLVASQFEALGVPVLDADQVSREVVEPGQPALAAIVEAFGPGALQADGTLDRRAMRTLVFADPESRRKLEAITHPAIRARIRAWIDAQTAPYCILANAILFESGMDRLVDRVLVVDVAEAVQLERLTVRDRIDPELARQMLAAQTSRHLRLERADDVIENAGSPADTARAVQALHEAYLARAGAARGR